MVCSSLVSVRFHHLVLLIRLIFVCNVNVTSLINCLLPASRTIILYRLFLSPAQSQFIVNPKPFLSDLTGKAVRIRLKWGQEYQGILTSSDAYMNLRLDKTEEFVDGQFAGFLGEVLIRCNNVLYIKAAPAAAESTGGAAQMEE